MKNSESMIQLGFITVIVLVVAGGGMMGMSWMANEFGSGGAMMFAVLVIVVVVIFTQQYLSGQQTKAVMNNIVQYAQQDAEVDKYRQQTILENARAARAINVIDARATTDSTKMIEQRASQLASMMTDAQVAKMRAQLFSQANSETMENASLD